MGLNAYVQHKVGLELYMLWTFVEGEVGGGYRERERESDP